LTERSLAGSAILVTRPKHQAGELVAAIEGAGGEALVCPVLRIEGRDRGDAEADARALPAADIVVFTSRNAVEHGFALHAGGSGRIAVIGPATARAIEAAGGTVDIGPGSGFDSERLLQSPELQNVAGCNVRIVRGDAGRELLADTLRRRGARVDYLSVYRRLQATPSRSGLQQVQARWERGDIRAVIIMSVESFDSLHALLPADLRDSLRSTPLVTPSRRVIQTIAEKVPGSPAFLATGPQAADMLRALIQAIAPGIRHESEN
jgi:uroporphyrinogen-III synthase